MAGNFSQHSLLSHLQALSSGFSEEINFTFPILSGRESTAAICYESLLGKEGKHYSELAGKGQAPISSPWELMVQAWLPSHTTHGTALLHITALCTAPRLFWL